MRPLERPQRRTPRVGHVTARVPRLLGGKAADDCCLVLTSPKGIYFSPLDHLKEIEGESQMSQLDLVRCCQVLPRVDQPEGK